MAPTITAEKFWGTSSKACYLFSILGKRGSCFWIFFSNTNLPHSKSRFTVPSAFITDSVRFGITGLNSNEIILNDSAAVYKTLPAFLISVLTSFQGAVISRYLLTFLTKLKIELII